MENNDFEVIVTETKEESKLTKCAKWVKQKVTNGYHKAAEFVKKHPEAIAVAGLAGLEITKNVCKNVTKSKNLKAEQDLKDRYVYDRRLGHYWELRRKLTSSEWLSVQRRYELGESMGDILEELRVLK